MSISSFVNGLIAGAGIALVLMSVGFLYYIAPVENQAGVSSTEIKVAIILGVIVTTVSIGYEYYLKKSSKDTSEKIQSSEKDTTQKSTISTKDIPKKESTESKIKHE